MGLSEDEAWGSVRFSFSVLNTLEEAQRAAETVVGVVEKMVESEETYSLA